MTVELSCRESLHTERDFGIKADSTTSVFRDKKRVNTCKGEAGCGRSLRKSKTADKCARRRENTEQAYTSAADFVREDIVSKEVNSAAGVSVRAYFICTVPTRPLKR